MKVAFIGLGNIGSIRAALGPCRHDVKVWNRTRSKAEALNAERARPSSLPGEAAREAEAVITMLSDGDRGINAVLESGGVLERLPRAPRISR